MKKVIDKRRSNTSTIGEAIGDMFRQYHLKPRFDQMQLINEWENLMGKTISHKTGKVFVKNDVLMVEIKSAPLKHELNMSKSKVLERIEERFEKSIIREIIFY